MHYYYNSFCPFNIKNALLQYTITITFPKLDSLNIQKYNLHIKLSNGLIKNIEKGRLFFFLSFIKSYKADRIRPNKG